MDRQIVCFAIPAVEVALARLSHPPVRTRPLAIAPLHPTRTLLREVSREAEDAGLCHLLAPNQDYEVTGLVDEHFSTVTVSPIPSLVEHPWVRGPCRTRNGSQRIAISGWVPTQRGIDRASTRCVGSQSKKKGGPPS